MYRACVCVYVCARAKKVANRYKLIYATSPSLRLQMWAFIIESRFDSAIGRLYRVRFTVTITVRLSGVSHPFPILRARDFIVVKGLAARNSAGYNNLEPLKLTSSSRRDVHGIFTLHHKIRTTSRHRVDYHEDLISRFCRLRQN